jgi:putative transcriptional regulator
MSPIRFLRLFGCLATIGAAILLIAAAPPGTDVKHDQPSLAGQFLIASPEMGDPRVRHTVLVMIRHTPDGAMGVIINRPVGEQPWAHLLAAIGETTEGVAGSVPIFEGGPVQLDRGFVLHSTDYRREGTLDVGTGVALTATPEIFRDIAGKAGPKQSLIAFGYAGWGRGQLEAELAHNAWFTAPLDPKLVFDENRDEIWDRAMERRTRDL